MERPAALDPVEVAGEAGQVEVEGETDVDELVPRVGKAEDDAVRRDGRPEIGHGRGYPDAAQVVSGSGASAGAATPCVSTMSGPRSSRRIDGTSRTRPSEPTITATTTQSHIP